MNELKLLRLSKLTGSIIVILLLFVLTSCNTDDEAVMPSSNDEEYNNYYETVTHEFNNSNMHERDYVLFLQEMRFGDNINRTFWLPSIRDSERFQSMTGTDAMPEFYRSLFEFYDEEVQEFIDFIGTIVHLATNRYFSVTADFRGSGDVWHRFAFSTSMTIDLKERRIVFLDDLIDINEEFIQLFMDGSLFRSDAHPDILAEFSSALFNFDTLHTEAEVRRALADISRPLTASDRGNAFEKPSFYLAPNRIYFIHFSRFTSSPRFYISLDDVEQFLKVDRW